MTSEDNDSVGSSTSLGSDNRRVGRRKQVGI
jgi:hypothetical protein